MTSSPTTVTVDRPGAAERPARANRPARRVFTVAWVLASLMGILWALATPVGASPDEPAHMIKAASVARGQIVGEMSHLGHVVQVPRYLANTHSVGCLAFHPNETGDCIDDTPADPGEIVDGTTTAGLYNPMYYALVGWPSLMFGDVAGIYAMRIVSAILAALFLAFAARFAFESARPALALTAVGVVATPTLLFLSGSVNPNALEVTATLATFTGMLAVIARARAGQAITHPLIVLAVSAAVAAQTRGLSLVWVAVALAAPLVLLTWAELKQLLMRREVLTTIAVVVVAAAVAGLWTLGSSSLTGSLDDEDHFQQYAGVGTSPLRGFTVVLFDTFTYGMQMIAAFGWLDTLVPPGVYFIWAAALGALALAAVAVLRGRRLVFAGVLTLAMLLLPPIIQGAYVTAGGYIWQGRYTLPLFAIAVVGIAMVIGERWAELRPAGAGEDTVAWARVYALVWAALAIGQVFCFAIALRRNSVGVDGRWREMVFDPEWGAPGGNGAVLVAFTLVTVASAVLAWWVTTRAPGPVLDRAAGGARQPAG